MSFATTYSDDYINKVLLGNEKLQSEIERLDIALNEANQELLDCIRENKKFKDELEDLKIDLKANKVRSLKLAEALDAIVWSWENDAGRECFDIAENALDEYTNDVVAKKLEKLK